MNINHILKQYWGFPSFRPLQEEIIQSVLEGKDTLALLPTGGGKSICFQVPALAKEGLCLVITPLIALMKDQVEKLKTKNIPALSVHTGMTYTDIKKTLQNAAYGNYKFLYVSPERLETSLFQEFLPALPVNLIAVDEAHCISQWGYDFRPSYLKIANTRQQKPNVPVLALTASATPEVQKDICEQLHFASPCIFRQSFERPNLSYSVFEVDSKINKLTDILKKVAGSAIVYCKSRRRTREIAELLKMEKLDADFYHAGLPQDERNSRQEKWISNTCRIMVCTNAFGMGIDKPDVRTVVHMDAPDCLENYYQEAGRAGRDGMKAFAVLLYHNYELKELEQLSAIRYPGMETIRAIYQSLANYLQLPSGTGEDDYFDFDINEFIKRFKLNIYQVMYSLQALQQEDIISFHEQIFIPSTVQFTASKELLFDFEKLHPPLEPLMKALLRSYGGIFDQPVAVSERQLARMLKANANEVKEQLVILNQHGIIKYLPQKENPQVRFRQNRVRAEDLYINISAYNKRKDVYEQRVKVMRDYIKSSKDCRAVITARYFGDENIKACGICDNCLRVKKEVTGSREFELISSRLKEILNGQSLSIKELLQQVGTVKEEHLWKIINYLVAEQKLNVAEDGRVSLK